MSDVDDMSFEILGTAPAKSFDATSLNSGVSSLNIAPPSPRQSHPSNKENRQDLAMDILMRRKSPSADMLKNFNLPSLNAEFPSLSQANLTEADLTKLQTIVAEHQQLRDNLVKANAVIKSYFTAVEKWQNDVQVSRDTDHRNSTLLMQHNQKLQQQVHRLQDELEEAAAKNKRPVAAAASAVDQSETMVSRATYKAVERQCSQLLAENLQFKDMEQQYVDTINCLKVNQASTEELVRMGQQDVSAERAGNRKLMGDLNAVREENQVLVQQAEIYKKDFIAERDARQRMAGEKEEVLTELNRLRMMLQAGQPGTAQQQMQMQLQQQQQGHCGLVRYTCPSCYSQFGNQQMLSQHMPQCGRHN